MGALTLQAFNLPASSRTAGKAALALALLFSATCPGRPQAARETQFSEGAKAQLERNFADEDISYLDRKSVV